MGGRKFFVKLIIGAFLMPSMVFANTVPSVVKNTKSVERKTDKSIHIINTNIG